MTTPSGIEKGVENQCQSLVTVNFEGCNGKASNQNGRSISEYEHFSILLSIVKLLSILLPPSGNQEVSLHQYLTYTAYYCCIAILHLVTGEKAFCVQCAWVFLFVNCLFLALPYISARKCVFFFLVYMQGSFFMTSIHYALLVLIHISQS